MWIGGISRCAEKHASSERERSYRYSGTVINEHISHESDAGRPDVMLLVRQSTVVCMTITAHIDRARSDYGKAEYIPWEGEEAKWRPV